MELLADITDALSQLLLDEHMDVLGVHIDAELARGDVLEDPQQLVTEGIGFLTLDDTLLREHLRVRDRAGDILLIHTAVKTDGAVELVR